MGRRWSRWSRPSAKASDPPQIPAMRARINGSARRRTSDCGIVPDLKRARRRFSIWRDTARSSALSGFAMTLLFVLAIRELGSSLFLYTSNTMVMAVLLLDYYEGGNVGITP